MPREADRVSEFSTSTGTGAMVVAGAVSGYRTWQAGFGGSNTVVHYGIAHDGDGTWESGIGTWLPGSTAIQRDVVLASSSGGSKVSFAAGDKVVYCQKPAETALLVRLSQSSDIALDLIPAAGQSASMIRVRNTSGTTVFTVDANGIVSLAGISNNVEIEGGSPALRFHETDASGTGAGRYQFAGLAAGNFYFQKATAEDWSTSVAIWRIESGNFDIVYPTKFSGGIDGEVRTPPDFSAATNMSGAALSPGLLSLGSASGESATEVALSHRYGGTQTFRVLNNGNVQNSNNSYGAISDQRKKENIADATPKLDDLNALRVVNFNMKGANLKQIGLIAQEVQAVFPALVEEDADGFLSVKYSVLVPMLVKAVQELTARVEALEGE